MIILLDIFLLGKNSINTSLIFSVNYLKQAICISPKRPRGGKKPLHLVSALKMSGSMIQLPFVVHLVFCWHKEHSIEKPVQ